MMRKKEKRKRGSLLSIETQRPIRAHKSINQPASQPAVAASQHTASSEKAPHWDQTHVAVVLAAGEVPHEHGLVAGGGEHEVRVVGVRRDGRHPAAVALLNWVGVVGFDWCGVCEDQRTRRARRVCLGEALSMRSVNRLIDSGALATQTDTHIYTQSFATPRWSPSIESRSTALS